jgi:hypothetical protein
MKRKKQSTNSNQQQSLAAFISATLRAEGTFVNSIPTTFTIRLPKPGHFCPITGLGRGAMNSLILGKNPPVKSISVRKKYAVRGIRLVFLHSLIAHLLLLAAEQCGGEVHEEDGE